MARSDMIHMSMCVDSGVSEAKVPERVVGRLGLGNLPVGFRLGRMDQVRELDTVLDEEHRDVVADQIPVAFASVETDSESPHVTGGVRRAPRPGHRGKADEGRSVDRRITQDGGTGQFLDRLGQSEGAVGGRTPGVDHSLGDPLVVEVHDLLTKVKIVEEAVGPRSPIRRLLSVSSTGTPVTVVRTSPPWAHSGARASAGAPGEIGTFRTRGAARRVAIVDTSLEQGTAFAIPLVVPLEGPSKRSGQQPSDCNSGARVLTRHVNNPASRPSPRRPP